MSDTELLFMPAVSAAALIRRKKLSPLEYMDAVLAAVDRLQPKLNCFITVTAEAARAGAKAAERAVMAGEPLGPLHGVPVSIKDLIPTKGVRTTFGSIAFVDNVPNRDDVLVTRLRAAGAIMIGKTTTPEFGIKGQTDASRAIPGTSTARRAVRAAARARRWLQASRRSALAATERDRPVFPPRSVGSSASRARPARSPTKKRATPSPTSLRRGRSPGRSPIARSCNR